MAKVYSTFKTGDRVIHVNNRQPGTVISVIQGNGVYSDGTPINIVEVDFHYSFKTSVSDRDIQLLVTTSAFNVGDKVYHAINSSLANGTVLSVSYGQFTTYVVDWANGTPGGVSAHHANELVAKPVTPCYTYKFVHGIDNVAIHLDLSNVKSGPKCECGAIHIKDHGHADWCDMSPCKNHTKESPVLSCNCPAKDNSHWYHQSWCASKQVA